MRNRHRYTTAILTAAFAAVLTSGCGTFSSESAPTTSVIGASLELTGADSALGIVYRDALQLRVDQINEQGLLGENRRLELRVLDNRSDAATSASNVAEFAADPTVAAVVTGGCAACTIASAERADELAIPVIALAAPDAAVEPLEERRYVFKLGPNASHTARELVRQIVTAELETIGVIAVDDPYGEEGLAELKAALQSQNALQRQPLEIVVEERVVDEGESIASAAASVASYRPEPSPFDPPVPEDADTGPDAVIIWAPSDIARDAAVALHDRGYRGRLFLDAIAASGVLLGGEVAEALTGATMIFTETLVIDEVIATSPARAARKNWFRAYVARYGSYHAYASFAADAVDVLVNALNRVGSVDRSGLRDAIESTELDGVTGALRMTPSNHSGLLPQALVTLVATNDRWRLAD